MALTVRRATLADAKALSALWRIGAERQHRAGVPHWTDDMIDSASVEAHIQAREAHLVLDDGKPVAAVLLQDEDPVFWDDRPRGEAFYLHRIAVDWTAAGGRATRVIGDWAAAEAVRRGRDRLRLDCMPQPKLVDVYKRLGFEVVDQCVKGGFDVVRFERRLT